MSYPLPYSLTDISPRSHSPTTMELKHPEENRTNLSTTALPRPTDEDHETYKDIQHEFTDLATQFSSSVLLSTFIATLMITFLAFADIMIGNRTSFTFQFGMVLCCMAAACHVALVLVAGRAATQAYSSSRLPRSRPRPDLLEYEKRLKAFSKCLRLCENVQAFGTTIFSGALLFMSWYIFHNHVFVYALFVFVALVGAWVYIGGFWEISWAGALTKKTLH